MRGRDLKLFIGLSSLGLLLSLLWLPQVALGKPLALKVFCETYPEAPACLGQVPTCEMCHLAAPPQLNPYGACVFNKLGQVSDEEFYRNLPDALKGIEGEDCDQDGVVNLFELNSGTLPGETTDLPEERQCAEEGCWKDYNYTYRKIWLDFCGEPPSVDEYNDFAELEGHAKQPALDERLEDCLDSPHWIGRDGVLWRLGHEKIRPVGSIKTGVNAGMIPILDYDPDYQLFVYSQIDDHDARDVLLADYTVTLTESGDRVTYSKKAPARLMDGQVMQVDKRVGIVTTFWNLAFYQNFTAVPRVLVAQVFRSLLGITMSRYQGINPPPAYWNLFQDYDDKGVTRDECAVCHSTLDAATYPFKYYNGLPGVQGNILSGQNNSGLSSVEALGDEENLTPLSYAKPRISFFENEQGLYGYKDIPEEGFVLGKPVADLREWASVIVNSDLYAAHTVRTYWKLLLGHKPKSYEQDEFKKLWQDFKGRHNFRVEDMLKDLVNSKAYSTRQINHQVRVKSAHILKRSFAKVLNLHEQGMCLELGKIPCMDIAHKAALFGTEAYSASQYTPIEEAGVSAPLAAERVALSACSQRSGLDFLTPAAAVIFKDIETTADGRLKDNGAAQQSIINLYERAHQRQPTDKEMSGLLDLYQSVYAAEKIAAGRNWATLACFAVLTSVEFLHY